MHLNDNKIINNIHNSIHNNENHNIENHNNNNDDNDNDNNLFTGGQQSCNRTLKVGPSFCGETHLLLNKLEYFNYE